MGRPRTVSDSAVVAAPAEPIYRALSDPAQMGRWSPEATGATVVGDWSQGARVGLHFEGHNKKNPWLRGRFFPVLRWTTRCVVTAAEEPSHFAFRATLPLRGDRGEPRFTVDLATWDYVLESVEGGTRVTETWTNHLPEKFMRFSMPLEYAMAGQRKVQDFQACNIAATLAGLKQEFEAGMTR